MPLRDDDKLLIGRRNPDTGKSDYYVITWQMLKDEIQALPFSTPNNNEQSTSS